MLTRSMLTRKGHNNPSGMRPSQDKLDMEEPWVKRIRPIRSWNKKKETTEPRTNKLQPGRLPSPRDTTTSSTDNPSSSSIPSYPGQRKGPSLRDRLIVPPKHRNPSARHEDKKPRKVSIAPLFQRIEAAFEAGPAPSTSSYAKTRDQRGRSPSLTPDDLLKQLKEHYFQTATTLHEQALMRLDLAQQNLSHKLTQALNGDEEFLVHAEQHIERLAIPLDEFMIQSEKRRKTTIQDSGTGTGSSDNAENGDGERNVELKTVCELVADATEQTRAFEKEMEELWREWVVAEKEARRLMRRVGEPGAGSEGGELLKRYTAAVEKEIAKAEEEVTDLGGEAVKMMKEIEKDFRKATLPDLHLFFQSIEEL